MPEPTIRILVGKFVDNGTVTKIIALTEMPKFEVEGWQFVLADPEDLSSYLTWLRNREIEAP
jgi:hypothetical protein